VACVERNDKNLGDLRISCKAMKLKQVGGTEKTSRETRRSSGVRPAHSTQRTGKPSTRGRDWQEYVACKGNT